MEFINRRSSRVWTIEPQFSHYSSSRSGPRPRSFGIGRRFLNVATLGQISIFMALVQLFISIFKM